MATFIMATRISPDAGQTPQTLETLEKETMKHVRTQCPEVEWLHSFSVLGPYDYIDVFTAPDVEAATKVATLVRTYGHAHSEVWAATEWGRFKELIHTLPDVA